MAGKKRGIRIDQTKLADERGNGSLSQQELADEAGVPLSCVVKAELRGRRTNNAVLTKLAEALGVSENALT